MQTRKCRNRWFLLIMCFLISLHFIPTTNAKYIEKNRYSIEVAVEDNGTGTEDEVITIDETGTYLIEVWGGDGGNSWIESSASMSSSKGGDGGAVSGKIYLVAGDTITLKKGLIGKDAGLPTTLPQTSGGGSHSEYLWNRDTYYSGGGGGYSEVVYKGVRLLLAGGGGGGSTVGSYVAGAGGVYGTNTMVGNDIYGNNTQGVSSTGGYGGKPALTGGIDGQGGGGGAGAGVYNGSGGTYHLTGGGGGSSYIDTARILSGSMANPGDNPLRLVGTPSTRVKGEIRITRTGP